MKLITKLLHGNKIKKATKVSSVPVGCRFSLIPEFKTGDLVICPMESGKTALLKADVWTPRDPGDQHFYKWETICYVE